MGDINTDFNQVMTEIFHYASEFKHKEHKKPETIYENPSIEYTIEAQYMATEWPQAAKKIGKAVTEGKRFYRCLWCWKEKGVVWLAITKHPTAKEEKEVKSSRSQGVNYNWRGDAK